MNKRYYEHTLPIIRGSLSNTYELFTGYTNYMLTWAYLLENPS